MVRVQDTATGTYGGVFFDDWERLFAGSKPVKEIVLVSKSLGSHYSDRRLTSAGQAEVTGPALKPPPQQSLMSFPALSPSQLLCAGSSAVLPIRPAEHQHDS